MLSSRSIVLKLFGSAALVFVLSHLLAAAASGVAFEIPRPSNEVNTRSDQGSNLQRGQTPVNVRSATRFDRDITGEKKKEAFPDLYEASIDELQAGLIRGDFTSADLVKAYLARISEVNHSGASLHAIIETNEHALAQAHVLDAERDRSAGRKGRGPLHGIPIVLKDNIGTAAWEGMNTTAGSYALQGSILPRDSTVVARLRKAGAILLGKANLSEWAHFRGNDIASGWSARGGQNTNPYYPGADPCGSSSGSGTAAAIGLATVALGTETDGSLICPASYQNVVGIKPTVGLTSRTGVIPISSHQDSIGPMARSVSDAAHVLSVIAGRDYSRGGNNYTLAQPAHVPNYVSALRTDALQGKRLGIPRKVFLDKDTNALQQSVIDAFEESVKTLEELGATVVDNADFEDPEEIVANNGVGEELVLDIDFKIELHKYLAGLSKVSTGVRTLGDIIEYDNAHPELELPKGYTAQDIFYESNATNGYNSTYYAALAKDHSLGRDRGIDYALKKYNLDALILPASGGYARTPAALAGYPIITVPLGFFPPDTQTEQAFAQTVYPAPGLPYGLAFFGTAYTEYDLIGYAYAYEQKTRTRLERRAYEAAVPKTQLEDVVRSNSRLP